ncbi:cache domain-containing protein [Neosynechococcus sphagnicola]|uniref:cache domain-containing protein n=1 Tax=Neosynechococcus sphagnicola TaxID=1501145 RepID=UPI00068E8983|nr:cache domain-containing protein [Neosynechococcus sphagnicola]
MVPFLVQVIAAVGLVGYLSYRSGHQAVQALASRLMVETGDRVEQHLNSYLQAPQRLNQINLAAIKVGFINPNDFQRLGKYFWQQLKTYDFTYMTYGNLQNDFLGAGYAYGQLEIAEVTQQTGGTIYSYIPDAQGNRTYPPKIFKEPNPNTDDWFTKTIVAGKPIWTPIYIWAGNTGEISISASAPIFDDSHRLTGVIGIDLSLTKISNFLESLRVGNSGKIFIVDRSGLLVADSSSRPAYKLIHGKPQRLRPQELSDPMIQSTAQQLIANFGSFKQIQARQQLHVEITDEAVFIQVIPYRDQYGIDWLIVVTVPESDFMAEIQANAHWTILLCGLTLLVATGIGILTTSWIIRPILRIHHASQAIARGEWQGTLSEETAIAELKTLAASFNWMSMQLRQSFDRVKASLQESKEKYQTLFQTLPLGVAITDPHGRIIEANPAAEQILEIHAQTQTERSYFTPDWQGVKKPGWFPSGRR